MYIRTELLSCCNCICLIFVSWVLYIIFNKYMFLSVLFCYLFWCVCSVLNHSTQNIAIVLTAILLLRIKILFLKNASKLIRVLQVGCNYDQNCCNQKISMQSRGNIHKNWDTTKIHIYMHACTFKSLTEVIWYGINA